MTYYLIFENNKPQFVFNFTPQIESFVARCHFFKQVCRLCFTPTLMPLQPSNS